LILGVRAYNSTASTIEVINAGGSGAVAADYDGTANPWDAPNMIQNGVIPGLTIYTVGINDWVNATNIDAYEASVRVTLTAAQAVGDAIIVIPAPSAVSTAPAAIQALYIQRLYSIGASLGIDVIDLSQRWISQEDGLANGFYVDTLHPSGLGYSDWAQLLANRIMMI
jgi:lysophospholipase L1-like esterase